MSNKSPKLTRDHIKEAVAYIFRDRKPNIIPENRRWILEIVEDEDVFVATWIRSFSKISTGYQGFLGFLKESDRSSIEDLRHDYKLIYNGKEFTDEEKQKFFKQLKNVVNFKKERKLFIQL